MAFNSMQYLCFLPIVLLMYYVMPIKVKNLWLLAASYFFYMCWNVKYAALLMFSTMVTYLCAIWLERAKYRKVCVMAGAVSNLFIVFLFKYSNFVFDNVEAILGRIHISVQMPQFDVLLPVGISFYTFQAIGYIIDVYRKQIKAERNFIRYALFLSFFPQLVAGPIERSGNLLPQFRKPLKFDVDNARYGLLTIAYGLFLKIVLADNIAQLLDEVWGNYEYVRGNALVICVVLFGFQIYCDFHGYTQIAIGSARMFGIRLHDNFDSPYLGESVRAFWRRWHMSLTTWFTDYLYIPLGGNRKGKLRKYFNTMIVFLASGLWHGAAWNYVAWGGINGIYMVIQDTTNGIRRRIYEKLHIRQEAYGWKIFCRIITFLLIDYSWIYFRSSSFSQAIRIQKRIWEDFSLSYWFSGSIFDLFGSTRMLFILIISFAILFITDFLSYRKIDWKAGVLRQQIVFRWCVYMMLLLLIIMYGAYGAGYEQTKFIYFQF